MSMNRPEAPTNTVNEYAPPAHSAPAPTWQHGAPPPPPAAKKSRWLIHSHRDAWLVILLGLLIPIAALLAGIWGCIHAGEGDRKAIPVAIAGLTIFVVRTALYLGYV
jgi:hypothetical protein